MLYNKTTEILFCAVETTIPVITTTFVIILLPNIKYILIIVVKFFFFYFAYFCNYSILYREFRLVPKML